MKKTPLKLSVLGLALTVLTTSHAASNTIPSAAPGFSVSLAALYLQPNADNLDYAIYTRPLPVPAPNWSQVILKPSYQAAFDIGIQYRFANPMNSTNFDWMHLGTSNSDSFPAAGSGASVAPPYYFGPLAQALVGSSANSTVKFTVDNVNLTLGHLINLGNIQIDPLAGLQFAYLKQDITSTYTGVDSTPNSYSITSFNVSRFTGIGPRLGVNAAYFFTDRFSISAKLGASLLLGSMRTTTNFNSFGAGNTTPAYTTLAAQNQNRVVPEADTKLEASYVAPLKTGANLTLAAGYLFTAYMNGINQTFPTALVPGAFNGGTIAVETAAQTQSNLSLNGPYAMLVLKF